MAPAKASSTLASVAAAAASSMSKLALNPDKADLPAAASTATAVGGKETQAAYPVLELATGETCHSLAWWRDRPTTIVAGMNGKSLKIFDIRVDIIQFTYLLNFQARA